jgi:TonB family protein
MVEISPRVALRFDQMLCSATTVEFLYSSIARVNEIDDKAQVSDTPPTNRLVIRIKLPAQDAPQPPARPPLSKGALLLVLGPVAVLLIWIGISVFRSEPTPAPAAPQPAAESVAPPVTPVEPEVRKLPAGPPSPVNQVVPDVPASARNTISGTIVVSIRVTLDKEGKVVATSMVDTGPSKYFQRLATESARQWTFTPSDSAEPRTRLVRFYFRRSGTTAAVK